MEESKRRQIDQRWRCGRLSEFVRGWSLSACHFREEACFLGGFVEDVGHRAVSAVTVPSLWRGRRNGRLGRASHRLDRSLWERDEPSGRQAASWRMLRRNWDSGAVTSGLCVSLWAPRCRGRLCCGGQERREEWRTGSPMLNPSFLMEALVRSQAS